MRMRRMDNNPNRPGRGPLVRRVRYFVAFPPVLLPQGLPGLPLHQPLPNFEGAEEGPRPGSPSSSRNSSASETESVAEMEEPGQNSEGEREDLNDEGEEGMDEELSSKVFGNDMLLEMILEKVIRLPNGGAADSKQPISFLRAVRRNWRSAVADILRKRREPVFKLWLNKHNSRDDMPYCKENGKLLAQFVKEIVASPEHTHAQGNIPTFSLRLDAEFFRRENHADLSNCLVQLGQGLVSLDMTFPINPSMMMLFHSFKLPLLQRLTVQFSLDRLQDIAPPGSEEAVLAGLMSTSQIIYPLQTILNVTNELKELHIRHPLPVIMRHGHGANLTPVGFEYVKLPQTLTAVLLDIALGNSDLTLLLENELPNLNQLRLFASTTAAYDDELIYQILEKYRAQLRRLNLRGAPLQTLSNAFRYPVTRIRFPVMERLEVVTISSRLWELDGEGDETGRWDSQLPALHELRLLQHTDSSLRKWANTHATSSLERLFVSLVAPAIPIPQIMHRGYYAYGYTNMASVDNPAPLTLETLQMIHVTMPFLTCLEISVCGEQTLALKYLFTMMAPLRKLAISVKGPPESNLVDWDSLLIGVPLEVAHSLRRNPSFWDSFELKDNVPSIRLLTELKSLALVEHFTSNANSIHRAPEFNESPMISDLAFQFAFLKMPALNFLLLSGRFRATPEMSDRWKRERGVAIHAIRRPSP